MLNKLRSNKGFTLIELLIVVAIIGILAAIAIPQFSKYRMQGYNSSANSDMRNIRTSEESLYAEWQRYGRTEVLALPGSGGYGNALALATGPGGAAPNIITTFDVNAVPRGIQIPVGNSISAIAHTDATGASFTLVSKHLMADTMYGADSDSTANYKLSFPAVGALNAGAPITLGVAQCPASAIGTVEFAAPWVAM